MTLPLIHDAAGKGNLDEVMRLAHLDPEVAHSQDGNAWTPLLCTAFHGKSDVVAYLLEHDANINHTDAKSNTSLILACEKGHMDVVELLLGRGADTSIANIHGWTCLTAAVAGDHVDVMRRLLRHQPPIPVDSRAYTGSTPLWLAWLNGKTEIARMLLEAGADPFVKSNNLTLFDLMRCRHKPSCVKLLQVLIVMHDGSK